MNNALHSRQANAGAVEFGRSVQAMERREQPVGIVHVKAGPVITHEIEPCALPFRTPEFDPGAGLPAGELPGIAEQVFQHDTQQVSIADSDHSAGNHEFYLALRLCLMQLGGDLPRQIAKVYPRPLHLALCQARQLEQVVNKLPHAQAAGLHTPEIVLGGSIQLVSIVLQQRLAKAIQRAQRCTQVVRDGIGKGFQLLIDGGERGRTFGDALLQLRGVLLDLVIEPGISDSHGQLIGYGLQGDDITGRESRLLDALHRQSADALRPAVQRQRHLGAGLGQERVVEADDMVLGVGGDDGLRMGHALADHRLAAHGQMVSRRKHFLARFAGAGAQHGLLSGLVDEKQANVVKVETLLDQVYGLPHQVRGVEDRARRLRDLGGGHELRATVRHIGQ